MLLNYFLSFIAIFVAVNALAFLPLFVTMTEGMNRRQKISIINSSIITALAIAIAFTFVGKWLFQLLGIHVFDFMIAGGVLLFIIAINNIINPEKKTRIPADTMGAVPLGTPLMVGPAVLTTILIISEAYGIFPTLVALVVNVLLAGIILRFSIPIINTIGISGTRAISKISSLLLAALAVMMVRKGIIGIITLHSKGLLK